MSEKRGPFDFIEDLSYKKTDLSSDGVKEYSAWLTNRFFAKFVDTIMHANQMNMLHKLDPQMQHDYYLKAVRARKRFSPRKVHEDDKAAIDAIEKYYDINRRKAKEAARVLTREQKERIIAGVRSIEEEGRNVGGSSRKS